MSGFLGSPLQKVNIDFLRSFYACAHFNSRKRAAHYLAIADSSISHHIAMVEEKLSLLLFSRLNSGYQLTPEGEILYRSLAKVFCDLDDAHTQMLSLNHERRLKRLNVYTPIPLGIYYLPTVIVEFQESYPDTDINLISFSEMPEIRTDHIDVLLAAFKPDYPNFQSIEAGHMTSLLYASPQYLKKMGHPKTIEDLRGHKFIAVRQAREALYGADWYVHELEKNNIEIRFSAIATSSLSSIQMAQAGGGICSYAKEMVEDAGFQVEPVLESHLQKQRTLYITSPRFMEKNTMYRHFIDLLLKRFRGVPQQ
jgi:DNA-binding transcriptional LysR family regulator